MLNPKQLLTIAAVCALMLWAYGNTTLLDFLKPTATTTTK